MRNIITYVCDITLTFSFNGIFGILFGVNSMEFIMLYEGNAFFISQSLPTSFRDSECSTC